MGHDTGRRSTRGLPADRDLRERLQGLIDARGLTATARALFVPTSTLARVVAGGAILDGTAELFRSRLAEVTEDAAGARTPAQRSRASHSLQKRLHLVKPSDPEPDEP